MGMRALPARITGVAVFLLLTVALVAAADDKKPWAYAEPVSVAPGEQLTEAEFYVVVENRTDERAWFGLTLHSPDRKMKGRPDDRFHLAPGEKRTATFTVRRTAPMAPAHFDPGSVRVERRSRDAEGNRIREELDVPLVLKVKDPA